MSGPARSSLRHGFSLGAFGLAAALLLAGVHQLTDQDIRCQILHARNAQLAAVLPDATLASQAVPLHFTTGDSQHQVIGVLRAGPRTLVYETVTRVGYGGDIALLVGLDREGRITGVQVVPPHHETPGLGDRIEAGKSDWITRFVGRGRDNTTAADWKVKPDGGTVDAFAGATITPRAVVQALAYTLDVHALQGTALLSAEGAHPAPQEHCP